MLEGEKRDNKISYQVTNNKVKDFTEKDLKNVYYQNRRSGDYEKKR